MRRAGDCLLSKARPSWWAEAWEIVFGSFTWENLWVFGLWLEGYRKSSGAFES